MTKILDEPLLRQTLITLLDIGQPAIDGVEYRLVGTSAALLRGVQLTAGDIDLLFREREAVTRLHDELSKSPATECLKGPVWMPDAKQYFARYLVDGVMVELSTVEVEVDGENDTLECFGRGPWQHFDRIPCGPYWVPTVSLELRLLTELHRGRPEKYHPIVDHLHMHGCDLELVLRGLAMHKISQQLHSEVLARLEDAAS